MADPAMVFAMNRHEPLYLFLLVKESLTKGRMFPVTV